MSRLADSHLSDRLFSRSAHAAALALDPWHLPSYANDDEPSSMALPAGDDHGDVLGRGKQLVFLGCPGVGKGTYASRLAQLLEVPHIAMGDLVRQGLSDPAGVAGKYASAMKQGMLLPDDVIFELLQKRLEYGITVGETGFILDGFPRTKKQAEILDQVTEIDLVVNLKLREDILISKCLGRRICSQCKGNFNLANIDVEDPHGGARIVMPPLLPPAGCEHKMMVRPDDTEEVVRARLRVYQTETIPVEEYYRKQAKLLDFNIVGGIPETWPRLLAALNVDSEKGRNLVA